VRRSDLSNSVAERDSTRWIVEKLGRNHDRAGFDCGHPSLNDFLSRYAGQNQALGVSQTYVATGRAGGHVEGYYSLASGAVAPAVIPETHRKRLPRYPIPVAHLGRLAVDLRSRGQRLGEFLLMDALHRIVLAADSIAMHAVEVWAIDDAAKGFYLKYGFIEMLDRPDHLYIPLLTVRRVLD